MTLDFADWVGLMGSALFVSAFAYANVAGALDKIWFNAINLAGALLLLFSLYFHFNLAAFVLEAAWAIIALGGLIAEIARRRRA